MASSVDVALEDLNLLLSDLDVGSFDQQEHGGFTESGVQPGGRQDVDFSKSCATVIDQVSALESALARGTAAQERMMQVEGTDAGGIVEHALARGMPQLAEESTIAAVRVEALSFMCSELQSLCIEAHRRRQIQLRNPNGGATECKDSDERIRVMAAMTALHRVLQVHDSHNDGLSSSQNADRSMAAIAKKTKALPPLAAERTAAGNEPLLEGLQLTADQRETAQRVQAAVAADFALRRRMLLRRCDVTVQSFLRGSGKATAGTAVGGSAARKGRGSQAETVVNVVDLPAPLKERREALTEMPRRISVDDALSAPRMVAWQHTRKMTTGDGKIASAIQTKMATLGDVPNRGGRVTEARAGPAMPAWTSRRDFGPGGGHGGGRWSGGGERRRGGKGRGGGGGRGDDGGRWGRGRGGGGGGWGGRGGSGGGRGGRGHKRKRGGGGERG